ncbi:MAG: transposase [Candidatus Obscuribacterales bacterium]|nr:transposase [Candidatus Obscuribacterales bacterium]
MPRRTFTKEQKLDLIAEAQESSFSAVAEKYDLQSSQLFDWNKKLLGSRRLSTVDEDELTLSKELYSDIQQIKTIQRLIVDGSDSLLAKLRNSRSDACNQANAVRAISSAFCELQTRKTELLDRLALCATPQADVIEDDPARAFLKSPAVRRIGEMASIEIIKEYILKKEITSVQKSSNVPVLS